MYEQAAVDVQIQTLRTVSPPSPCPFITGQIKVELTNLTLLPPSPYRLIIEQIKVDLINLEDEVETFNSLLPIVAASLYLLFLMMDSDLTYDGINPVYRREKRKRRTCVTVKMTERPKLSEVSPNYPHVRRFALSPYFMIVDKLCLTCFFVTAYVIQVNNNWNNLIWLDLTMFGLSPSLLGRWSFCIKKSTDLLSPIAMAILLRRGQFAQIETAMTEV